MAYHFYTLFSKSLCKTLKNRGISMTFCFSTSLRKRLRNLLNKFLIMSQGRGNEINTKRYSWQFPKTISHFQRCHRNMSLTSWLIILTTYSITVFVSSEFRRKYNLKRKILDVNLGCFGLNRFFIGVNEYDSYEMLTFASWKTKVC